MLKSIMKYVYKLLYEYHYNMSNYCYKKVDSYGPEYNDYWEKRVIKHADREFKIVEKLVQLEGI